MLSNNTATFSRSKFAPQFRKSDLIDEKYLLRNHLESDEISRLYTAKNVLSKEHVHIRIFTEYFARFISDEAAFLDDMVYYSEVLESGQLEIIDKGFTAESFYIVYSHQRLESLNELVKKIGTLNSNDALIIINEAINYLKNAYRQFKKPHLSMGGGNIYVNDEGEVRFSDYGVSEYLLERYPFFNVKGFHEFVAPELNRNTVQNASRASDIYSLSCILYKMVTGRNPSQIGKNGQYSFHFSEEEKSILGENFLRVFNRMSAFPVGKRARTYAEIQMAVQLLLVNGNMKKEDYEQAEKGENEIISLGRREFLFSEDFQKRMDALKNVADFIKADSVKKESKYIYKFLFYAILLLFSTFMILVKFTIDKV